MKAKWLIVAGLLVIGMAVVGAIAWKAMTRAPREVADAVIDRVTKKEETQIDLTMLVTRVRELNRLETAAMRVVHVATTEQSVGILPSAVAGDELTFMAVGDVIAGIDLSKLDRNDVWREGEEIVIRLPDPEILVTRVDNQESKVLNRKTGLARRGDPHLESRARAYAEGQIHDEAVRKGILKLARDNGEARMAELLNKLGAERIRFVRDEARPLPRG